MCDALYKLKRHLDQRENEAVKVIKQCQDVREFIEEYEKKYSNTSEPIIALPINLDGYSIHGQGEPIEPVSPTSALRKIIKSDPTKEWLHIELEAEIEDMLVAGTLNVKEGRKPKQIVHSSLNRLLSTKEVVRLRKAPGKPRFILATLPF